MTQIYLPGLIQDLWIIHLVHHLYLAMQCSSPLPGIQRPTTIIFELICYAKISECTKSLAPHLLHLCSTLYVLVNGNCDCENFSLFSISPSLPRSLSPLSLSHSLAIFDAGKIIIEWTSTKFYSFRRADREEGRVSEWDEKMLNMKNHFLYVSIKRYRCALSVCLSMNAIKLTVMIVRCLFAAMREYFNWDQVAVCVTTNKDSKFEIRFGKGIVDRFPS